jgi:L-lysine exporter family protein LysE/ArgO
MSATAFFTGFATSAALIIAIGAQNAFVLRQGLKREHVSAIVLFCALSDALLISAGVAGLGTWVSSQPWLFNLARIGGAAFLLWYGLRATQRALASQAAGLEAAQQGQPLSLRAALVACAAFTYLNPHVYLDTVVLMGTLSSQFCVVQRLGLWCTATDAFICQTPGMARVGWVDCCGDVGPGCLTTVCINSVD